MKRFRRRTSYLPIALLILAVGMCGRARNTSSPNERATNAVPPRPAQTVSRHNQEPQPHSEPVEHHNAADEATAGQQAAVHHDSSQLHLRVVGVHDGDTITGLDGDKFQHKIRLDAIDAPELGQPFGQAAKKALSEKVFGRDVVVIPKTTDRYGRTVGHVLLAGRDVNLEMLEEGMAWHYEQYDHNVRLRQAEAAAREAKRGLWNNPDFEPPWEYRKEHGHGRQKSRVK